MLYFISPSLKVSMSLSACGPTRSMTHWRILGERTLVMAPSVTSATICSISTNSSLAYFTAALHRGTSTSTPRSLMRSLTW